MERQAFVEAARAIAARVDFKFPITDGGERACDALLYRAQSIDVTYRHFDPCRVPVVPDSYGRKSRRPQVLLGQVDAA